MAEVSTTEVGSPTLGTASGASSGAAVAAVSFDSLDGSDAFEVMRAELEAHPISPRINTDVGFVVQTALAMPARLDPVLPELNVAVPNYDFASSLRRLKTTALSLNYLQAKYRILRHSTNTALVDWLTRRRSQFQAFGMVLVRHDLIGEAELDALRHTNNHHALGYDVMGLAELLLTHFAYVECKLLTREQLIEARAKANELFMELGTREFGPNAAEEVKALRRKNFALIAKQFNTLEAAVRYGRSEHGDAGKFIPALYPKRGPRKDDDETAEDEFDSADAAPAANAPDNISTGSTAAEVAQINRHVAEAVANASGIGVPAGVPFRLTEDK